MSKKFDSAAFHSLESEPTLVESEFLEDPELNALLAEAEAEQLAEEEAQAAAAQPQISQEEMLRNDVLRLLATRDDAPDQATVHGWKQRFGEEGINVTAFDKNDIYIYSYITLGDWEAIQGFAEKAKNTQAGQKLERLLKEKVIRKCLLWPKLTDSYFNTARAGVLDALYQGVMIQSYMLSPQQVLMLSTKL